MPARLPETHFGVLLCLILAVLICYANALSGTFQFDDYNVIVNNPSVHSWAGWAEGLSNGIRPLLKFSYTLNWTMGTGVIGFHLTNLLIHLTNAYLVYRLAQAFVQQQWQQDKLRQVPIFVALLFAAHPVYTEAVTYICGRSTSLMALFYLAGLLTYISGRTQQNSVKVYGLTPLFFVIALGVKETAVTFPLALLLWEYACGGKWKRALTPQWPSWLVLILGALIFLFSDSYLSHMERSAQLNSLQGNIANQIAAFPYLMRQWALPLWLNIDPDLPLQNDFSVILLSLVFFLALFVIMVACWRERPWISFALAWAMLQLIPLHLFLPRIDIANDRQMYLAGWPLSLALCIELRLWTNGVRTQAVVALLLLGSVSLTVLRNQDYASEIRLWEDTAIKSPGKARVHNNLGYAYMLARRNDEARREFTIALQLDPSFYKARYNLYRLDDEVDLN
ncbi:TPR_REGION domain-containing protein [Candidatus Nitrotoga sp. HW29]|uniref:tetratricopeptide repeat protein n=1 Tax=Candidatus Nitrotoga sp. HW29 TaxID=2886963 RepID=UPI001EF2D55C|nr:tetratricopeptide repeat protein [Candidatus Nitrotoga sp. HW29]CAH1905720.1 TPR_REGION domain-containing protein [Candidatus Nitrotoga sp. HW29]